MMKSKLLVLALFASTAGAVALYPAVPNLLPTPGSQTIPLPTDQARIDVVFALDTTGSMGGLIEAAKEKIWSIASTMASAEPAPEIRIGLVAYRDRGDAYVTRVIDLSSDLDSVQAALMDFQAAGGGDGPESVNQALFEAVNSVSWSQSEDTYKAVFLVGDAPPHTDYQNDVQYQTSLATAQSRGIVVNTIQCGEDPMTTRNWQQIAQLGQGEYFRVEQNGSAVAVATPFDKKLAELSRSLDSTRLYYGSSEERAKREDKVKAAEKLHRLSSAPSLARRATFNASPSGTPNQFGDGELIEDVSKGDLDLATMAEETLPEPMQSMTLEERQELVKETIERRTELQAQIRELADQRATYIASEVAEMDGVDDSLDHQIYGAIRKQTKDKGLRYEQEAPSY